MQTSTQKFWKKMIATDLLTTYLFIFVIQTEMNNIDLPLETEVTVLLNNPAFGFVNAKVSVYDWHIMVRLMLFSIVRAFCLPKNK